MLLPQVLDWVLQLRVPQALQLPANAPPAMLFRQSSEIFALNHGLLLAAQCHREPQYFRALEGLMTIL